MYKLVISSSKVKKRVYYYLKNFPSIKNKFERLKENPRSVIGAHPLHGRLKGKWSCWLGANIRMIYSIDDLSKRILIEAIGSHKVY